jgi:hypothetical protein
MRWDTTPPTMMAVKTAKKTRRKLNKMDEELVR